MCEQQWSLDNQIDWLLVSDWLFSSDPALGTTRASRTELLHSFTPPTPGFWSDRSPLTSTTSASSTHTSAGLAPSSTCRSDDHSLSLVLSLSLSLSLFLLLLIFCQSCSIFAWKYRTVWHHSVQTNFQNIKTTWTNQHLKEQVQLMSNQDHRSLQI